jgi:hypothetical protein
MNLELTEEILICSVLKDLKYPQDKKNGYYATILGNHGKIELVYIPTLSELIHSCGKDFELSKGRHKIHDPWTASIEPMNESTKDYANGKTPEEATARLWIRLKLNKKCKESREFIKKFKNKKSD